MTDYKALSMDEQIALQRENEELREHIERIAEAQKDNDWQLMGISIREAKELLK